MTGSVENKPPSGVVLVSSGNQLEKEHDKLNLRPSSDRTNNRTNHTIRNIKNYDKTTAITLSDRSAVQKSPDTVRKTFDDMMTGNRETTLDQLVDLSSTATSVSRNRRNSRQVRKVS